MIDTKRPRDYGLAVSLLQDLRALADRQGDMTQAGPHERGKPAGK